MEQFLDAGLYEALGEVIRSSPVFEKCKHYNLLCVVVVERLEDCIKYLNDHSDAPKTETDFLVFIMFACIVVDAVKELRDQLGLEVCAKSSNAYEYFGEICKSSPLNIPEDECPTDDEFFEYFRAIAFAHPFETSRAKFLRKSDQTHYSPWVIANRISSEIHGIEDCVGG